MSDVAQVKSINLFHKSLIDLPTDIHPILLNDDWFSVYRRIPTNSVDLILTDSPFGVLEKETWDQQVDLVSLEATFDSILKVDGQVIMFCNLDLYWQIINTFTVFKKRTMHIWKKTSAMPINEHMPLPDHEFIVVLNRVDIPVSQLTWNPRDIVPPGRPYTKNSTILTSPTRRHVKSPTSTNIDGKRWVPTILSACNKPNMLESERSNHPSQKPESLLRMLIRGYSDPGQLILDCFAGSGSTLISAFKESRRSVGVEIEERFYLEAKSRITAATKQQVLAL